MYWQFYRVSDQENMTNVKPSGEPAQQQSPSAAQTPPPVVPKEAAKSTERMLISMDIGTTKSVRSVISPYLRSLHCVLTAAFRL
jgi:hypothetical protein